MQDKVEEAKIFAKIFHEGQKYGKRDFFTSHPLKVYGIIKRLVPKDYNLQIAALCHDLLEDTPCTYMEIEDNFGRDVAELVLDVTKTESNTFPYLKKQRSVILKFADRLHNLSCMEHWSQDRKKAYIKKSKFWKS
jgi:GTP diphosphokinase / guanosine-3',5'-bis(diphosphate) 3'-diphosphatase